MPGGGILCYYRDSDNKPYILVGKESTWLSDHVKRQEFTLSTGRRGLLLADLPDLATNLEFSTDTAKDVVIPHFRIIAEELSAQLGYRIQFEQPTLLDGGGGCYTRFRYLKPYPFSQWSLPKGSSPPPRPAIAETKLETAFREFYEETGFNLTTVVGLNPDELVNLTPRDDYNFYKFRVREALISEILKKVNNRKGLHYSELFDIKFMDRDEYIKNRENDKRITEEDREKGVKDSFNKKSSAVIDAFLGYAVGGRRKTKRRNSRKHRTRRRK